jgi:hypothetical protein
LLFLQRPPSAKSRQTFLQLIRLRQFLLFQLRFLLIRSSCRPIKVLYLRFCMSSNTAFRKLLKSESSAALPATEDAVVELSDLYVVRPEARPERGSRNSKPTPERLELAAAILWFNTHVSDPVAALVRLSFEMQEKLAECFVKVFAAFAGDSKWQSKLSSYLKFAAPSGSTPQKRAAQPARGRARASVPPLPPPVRGCLGRRPAGSSTRPACQ